MSGPNDPQYPGPQDPQYQPYPAGPGYPPPAYPGRPPAQRPGLADRLGDRLAERPVPRLGVSLAGVGVVLSVVGVIAWGATYIVEGGSDGFSGSGGSDSRHFLGAGLALAVVAAGYALLIAAQKGPLATAGIAASALGVPVAMLFLTYEKSGSDPINFDAITWVSIVVYVVSFLLVRGARGHAVYIGGSLLLLWAYLLDKVAPSTEKLAGSVVSVVPGTNDAGGDSGVTSIAVLSLTIGAIYYLTAWGLDRSGRHGIAVVFALVGLPAVTTGLSALAPDLEQLGTGVAVLIVGLLIAGYGARYNRRFTTWFWTFEAAVGAVLIVQNVVDSTTGTSIGISLIVLGAVFVAGGVAAARLLNEPDDVVARAEVT